MWEQEGIGNWETGMVGRHSFLLFFGQLETFECIIY